MSFAQYCRLRLHVADSNRLLVRRAHRMLSPKGRSAGQRDARHAWLRQLLDHHAQARDIVRHFRL